MKRTIPIAVLLVVALIVTASTAAPPPSTIAQLRAKIANLRSDNADLQTQIDAQNQVISDQSDTITRLRYRLANQPDPLDVITARSDDALWTAMIAIWRVFPRLSDSAICGYDKTQATGGDVLTLTTFSFSRWSGC